MIPVVSFSGHGFPASRTEPEFSSFLAIALGVARQGRKVIAISLDPGAPDISDWMNFEWQPTRGVLDWLAGADEHVTEYFSEIKKPGWFFDTPRTSGAGRLGYSPATKQGNESLVVNGLRFQAFLVAIEKQIGDFVAFVYIPESLLLRLAFVGNPTRIKLFFGMPLGQRADGGMWGIKYDQSCTIL